LIQIIARFSVLKISQGSVATHLTYVGISVNNFIASFLLNVSVKELWQEAQLPKVWQREDGKFVDFNEPTHFWRRPSKKRLRKSTNGLYCQKL